MPGKDELSTIHSYLSGELNGSARIEFEDRLASEPALSAQFDEMRRIWNAAGTYAPPAFSSQPALTRFQARIDQKQKPRSMWYAVAAAAVVAGLIGAWTLFFNGGSGPVVPVYASSDMHKDLDDGSVLELREGTLMRMSETFGSKQRVVEMVYGEAAFDIAKDKKRPFVIQHRWAQVRVTGTAFVISIDTLEQTYTLKVTEGEVLFTPALSSKPIPVTAGNGIVYDAQDRQITRLAEVDGNALSWKTGELFFPNCSLDKVISDLKAHYRVPITLENAQLGKTCRFASSRPYKNVSLKVILDAVATTYGMKVETKTDGGIVLKGGTCPR